MWFVLLSLLFLCACAPPVPRHGPTMALCGWQPTDVDEVFVRPPPANDACIEALLADLSVDVASFDGAEDELAGLLTATRALAVGDLGEEVPAGLSEPLGPVADATGGREVAGLLYDWLADHVTLTVLGDDPGLWASYDPRDRVLTVHGLLDGLHGAAILVHEARHGDGQVHVPCRDDPRAMCDDSRGGAYSAQRAYHALVLDGADHPLLVATQVEAIEHCRARIE